jgi:hypothetical protein
MNVIDRANLVAFRLLAAPNGVSETRAVTRRKLRIEIESEIASRQGRLS